AAVRTSPTCAAHSAPKVASQHWAHSNRRKTRDPASRFHSPRRPSSRESGVVSCKAGRFIALVELVEEGRSDNGRPKSKNQPSPGSRPAWRPLVSGKRRASKSLGHARRPG